MIQVTSNHETCSFCKVGEASLIIGSKFLCPVCYHSATDYEIALMRASIRLVQGGIEIKPEDIMEKEYETRRINSIQP